MIDRLEPRRLFSTPTLSTSNVTVTQGPGTSATVTVKLSKKTTAPVKVTYTTKSGTALSGTNFTAHRGTIVIAAGKTSGTVSIPLFADLAMTSPTKFYVDFLTAVHAVLPKNLYSRVTIKPGNVVTPTVISNNLDDASAGTQFSGGADLLAANFSTPTTVALQSVSLLIGQVSGAATVQIYSDSGGVPGTLVGTLTSPSTYSTSPAATTFSSSTGINLTAGTYWVVLRAPGGFNWSYTTSGSGTGVGFLGGSAQSSSGGGTWFANTGNPLQMSVTVD